MFEQRYVQSLYNYNTILKSYFFVGLFQICLLVKILSTIINMCCITVDEINKQIWFITMLTFVNPTTSVASRSGRTVTMPWLKKLK